MWEVGLFQFKSSLCLVPKNQDLFFKDYLKILVLHLSGLDSQSKLFSWMMNPNKSDLQVFLFVVRQNLLVNTTQASLYKWYIYVFALSCNIFISCSLFQEISSTLIELKTMNWTLSVTVNCEASLSFESRNLALDPTTQNHFSWHLADKIEKFYLSQFLLLTTETDVLKKIDHTVLIDNCLTLGL